MQPLSSSSIQPAASRRRSFGRAFSLIELVIVIVIIGILAAIAIPRLSRGAAGASESALSSNLAILRNSIDLYAAEHDGKFPTVLNYKDQLTRYSDVTGTQFADTKTDPCKYGPYLRKIPPLPLGPSKNRDSDVFVDGSTGNPGDNPGGWFYNPNNGNVRANLPDTELDVAKKKYNDY
jgi:prepilin-type N-terminal cleavage/methylation domain-containing protein